MRGILNTAIGVIVAIIAVVFLWGIIKWFALLIGLVIILGFVLRLVNGNRSNY